MDSIATTNASTVLWDSTKHEQREKFLLESKYVAAEERRDQTINDFFLVSISLVIYSMQCGFALLEAGSVSCKNTASIVLKNLITSFVSAFTFWLIGYAFAYGDGSAFIGYTTFAHSGLNGDKLSYWFFQYVLAATAVTIVSGPIAERCTVWMYPVYTILITGFIYPVVVHWAWSRHGWLAIGRVYDLGYDTLVHIHFEDAGGGGVVHTVGGLTGFIAAAIIGPRSGCFDEETSLPKNIKGQSAPLATTGAFVLLLGFIALNCAPQGAQMTASFSESSVGKSVSNTVLGGTGALLAVFVLNRFQKFRNRSTDKRWGVLTPLNSCLAGMVSVCACSQEIATWASFTVGIWGGIVYSFIKWGVLRMKIDDPLQATAVHVGGGVTGVISLAFFKEKSGIIYAWNKQSGLLLGWQLAGVAAIVGWACLTSSVLFLGLKLTGFLRSTSRTECKGLAFSFFRKPRCSSEPKRHKPDKRAEIDIHDEPTAPMLTLASIKKKFLKKSDKNPGKKPTKKTKKKSDLEAPEPPASISSSPEIQDDVDVVVEVEVEAEAEAEVEEDVKAIVEVEAEAEVGAETEEDLEVIELLKHLTLN